MIIIEMWGISGTKHQNRFLNGEIEKKSSVEVSPEMAYEYATQEESIWLDEFCFIKINVDGVYWPTHNYIIDYEKKNKIKIPMERLVVYPDHQNIQQIKVMDIATKEVVFKGTDVEVRNFLKNHMEQL